MINGETRSVRGFTLVELLVTITIVALLTVFSMAALQKGVRSSKEACSLSNLRQLGVVIQTYVADRGYYPPATDGIDFRGYWADSISVYLGLDSWWGSNMPDIVDSPAKTIPTAAKWRAYIANPNVMPDMLWGAGKPVPTPRVQRPAETILLADGVQNQDGWVQSHIWDIPQIYDSNPANANQPIPMQPNLDDGSARIRFPHGRGTSHVLFADGHAEPRTNASLLKRNFVVYGY